MEYLSGPEIILFIQQMANPILDVVFKAITFLGNEDFYLVAIPLVYWCIDKKFGVKLGIVFLASAYLNDFFKHLFTTERPSEDLVRVLWKKSGGGYAFPSGHSQGAVVFWGTVAWELKKAWATTVAIILMFLIGISRLYLGVHWPIDVLGGWLIGAVIMGVYILYDAKVLKRELTLQLLPKIILVLVIAVILYLISPESSKMVGTFVGLAIGYFLEEKYVNFTPRSVWWYQLLKIVVGLVTVYAIRILIKMALPEVDISDFFRYTVIGFWIAYVIPVIFKGRKG